MKKLLFGMVFLALCQLAYAQELNCGGVKVTVESVIATAVQVKVDATIYGKQINPPGGAYSGFEIVGSGTCSNCTPVKPGSLVKTWTITGYQADVTKLKFSRFLGACQNETPIVLSSTSVLPINGTIVLRGDNTRYVSLLSDSKLAVNQNSKSDAVSITVLSAGNGKVALQASNGKYVTIDASSVGRVSATKNSIGATEKFTVEELASGGFSIKASNGKYIQAAYSSGGVLLANSNSPKKFTYQ